jgi:2-polyprenyl-3-methyl-5-hydroxy-6-metoxy-1,4-benzoquinol methylase
MRIGKDEFDAALRPGFRRATQSAYQALDASQTDESRQRLQGGGFREGSFETRSCPVCGAGTTQAPLLRKLGLEIVRCADCGMVYSRTVLDRRNDRAFYEETAFQSAYLQLKRNDDYAALERLKARYIVQMALQHAPDARSLLEIGSGAGRLLSAARDAGLSVLGVEANAGFAAESRALGHEVLEGWFPEVLEMTRGPFDVVAMLDVLEHCLDPRGFLRAVAARLAPNGVIVIQVPNYDSLLVRLEGAASSVVCHGHWNYFTPATLERCLRAASVDLLAAETIISEADRIAAFPRTRVAALAHEICGEVPPTQAPEAEWLHAHGLGYKLLACCRPRPGAQG